MSASVSVPGSEQRNSPAPSNLRTRRTAENTGVKPEKRGATWSTSPSLVKDLLITNEFKKYETVLSVSFHFVHSLRCDEGEHYNNQNIVSSSLNPRFRMYTI